MYLFCFVFLILTGECLALDDFTLHQVQKGRRNKSDSHFTVVLLLCITYWLLLTCHAQALNQTLKLYQSQKVAALFAVTVANCNQYICSMSTPAPNTVTPRWLPPLCFMLTGTRTSTLRHFQSAFSHVRLASASALA